MTWHGDNKRHSDVAQRTSHEAELRNTLRQPVFTVNPWTLPDAKNYLKGIMPIFKGAGYDAKIIGSVAKKGTSNHDLDILLTADGDNFDFEKVMEKLPGDFTLNMDTYEYYTADGRLVDIWFEDE